MFIAQYGLQLLCLQQHRGTAAILYTLDILVGESGANWDTNLHSARFFFFF